MKHEEIMFHRDRCESRDCAVCALRRTLENAEDGVDWLRRAQHWRPSRASHEAEVLLLALLPALREDLDQANAEWLRHWRLKSTGAQV